MPSIEYDIHIDENRNNSFTFIWFDFAGARVDLTDMGAVAEIVDGAGNSISRITDTGNITLHTDAGNEGKIVLVFPQADLTTLDANKYFWELFTFPTSGSPGTDPSSLLKGRAFVKKERASLT